MMHSWVGTLTCGVGSHGAGPLGASLLFCQCCPDLFRHRFPLQGVKAQHPQVSSFLQHQQGLYFFSLYPACAKLTAVPGTRNDSDGQCRPSVRSITVAAQAQEAQLPAPSSHWYANSAMSSAFILNSEQIQSYTCCALPMALL